MCTAMIGLLFGISRANMSKSLGRNSPISNSNNSKNSKTRYNSNNSNSSNSSYICKL